MGLLTDTLYRRNNGTDYEQEQTQQAVNTPAAPSVPVTPAAPETQANQPLQPQPMPQVTTPANVAVQNQQIQQQKALNPNDYTSVYDMVTKYTRPQTYANEIQQAERNRKLAQLTDIIGMAGNIGTLLAGRRLYGQPVSATQIANDRLEKLRALNRDGQMRYDNALLNARLKDQEIKRAEQARREQMAYNERMQKTKNDADWTKWRAEMGYKMGKDAADRDALNARTKANLAMQERKLQAENYNKSLDRQSRERIADKKNGKVDDKNNPLVPIVGRNGRKIYVRKNSLQADAAYLYKRMQDILRRNPDDEKAKNALSDIAIMMNQAGDNKDKMVSVIMSRLQDFPELEAELDNLEKLNQMYPNATAAEWDGYLNGNNSEEDFIVWDPDNDLGGSSESESVIEYKHK